MAFETVETVQRAGAKIALRNQLAEGQAKGVVMICHGLAEMQDATGASPHFLPLGAIMSMRNDHRGHGATTAPDAPLGRFAARDGASIVLEDVAAIRALVAERHPACRSRCSAIPWAA